MLTPSPSQLKLYEILKTDEQCKSIIEKLEFWCYVKLYWNIEKIVSKYNWKYYTIRQSDDTILSNFLENDRTVENIWLPLSEHFIRLYCENNKIIFTFNRNEIMIWTFYPKNKMTIIVIDYEKDFNSQSDECYNSIYEALINL